MRLNKEFLARGILAGSFLGAVASNFYRTDAETSAQLMELRKDPKVAEYIKLNETHSQRDENKDYKFILGGAVAGTLAGLTYGLKKSRS